MKCNLCPHNCNIDRNNYRGRCKASDKIEIGGYSLHKFEEPCISGKSGSGTIFFSKCNLNCVFCQNYEISNLGNGKEIGIDDLVNIFIEQQENNANNINLVSPTIYVDKIAKAIKIAKSKGLNIPIIYNTNGYEKIETLKMIEGLIDVYLPDLKYSDDILAEKYSGIQNYFEVTTTAIKEMERQVGAPKFYDNGIIKSGLIVRHLILPGNIQNTKNVLKWIKKNLSSDIYISIMSQYFPCYNSSKYPEINRKLTKLEYDEVEKYIYDLNFENGYMQDFSEEDETCYVPKWDY